MIPSWLLDIYILLTGFCVGSFLNVCIYRFLREESIVFPGSHCPTCKKPIEWYDNIPLISFIILGGKCRKCDATISPRYFFIELLTGLVFIGSIHYFGWTARAGSGIVFLTLLLGISAADLEEQIIPDEMSLSGIIFGLLFSSSRRAVISSWNNRPRCWFARSFAARPSAASPMMPQ